MAHTAVEIMREISVAEMPAARNGRPIQVVAQRIPAPRRPHAVMAAMAVEVMRVGAMPSAIMVVVRKPAPRATGAPPAAEAEALAAVAEDFAPAAVEDEVAEDSAVVEVVAAAAVEY